MLIDQANALLGRAGLLAPPRSPERQEPKEGGVPPLASLADLRAAAPALAVAVFEALLEVSIHTWAWGLAWAPVQRAWIVYPLLPEPPPACLSVGLLLPQGHPSNSSTQYTRLTYTAPALCHRPPARFARGLGAQCGRTWVRAPLRCFHLSPSLLD